MAKNSRPKKPKKVGKSRAIHVVHKGKNSGYWNQIESSDKKLCVNKFGANFGRKYFEHLYSKEKKIEEKLQNLPEMRVK